MFPFLQNIWWWQWDYMTVEILDKGGKKIRKLVKEKQSGSLQELVDNFRMTWKNYILHMYTELNISLTNLEI